MALTGVDAHLQAAFDTSFAVPFRRNSFLGHATSTLLVIKSSTWTSAGFPGPGSVPPTGSGAACDRTTPGALPLPAAVVGKKIYLNYLNMISGGQVVFELYDRLVHTSGLNGTLTTAQTVNSAALPARAGTGELVIPCLEVYTATGATTVTVSLGYTNSSGTSGRTAATSSVSMAAPGRLIPLNVQTGDFGVQSVQTVTLSATTGSAGNFGVTLLKLKAWQPSSGANFLAYPQNPTEQGGAIVDDNECLFFAGTYQAAATTLLDGLVSFIQA